MDRYNEVKLQLKNWEKEFVQHHRRKPNKEDIDQAPEETRNLYKEYRTLKQANENSSNAAANKPHQQAKSTTEKSDCWGAHLNRSVLPASSPKLTSKDRDSLQASAQYYGLKLKHNLGTLTKDKPVSLKKSGLPGRVPLNSLKSGQTGGLNTSITAPTEKTTSDGTFSPRVKTCSGFVASNSKQSEEPEEPFEAFECVKEFSDEPSGTVSRVSVGIKSQVSASQVISSQNGSDPAPSSALLKSLSPPETKVGDEVKTRGTFSDSADMKENSDILRTPCRAPYGVSFIGSPQVRGDLRVGAGGKPSPACRLSTVNMKWLERCQVFGEMEAEEKPGAGNQEVQAEGKVEKPAEGEESGEKGGLNIEGERREEVVGNCSKIGDDVGTASARQPAGKSQKGEGESKRRRKGRREEVPTEPTLPPAPEGETQPEPKGTKRRGRKREREGDEAEGGVKKKRRDKKKEESSDGKLSPARGGGRGGKRRRTKKTGEEEEDDEVGEEGEKKVKEPKKMPKENLLGEVEEEFVSRRMCQTQPITGRGIKGAEGNFVKINLKKKSHVRGYALRGLMLRKQLYMQKFQLKGERFGGGGGSFGRGWRGGFRGRGVSRQGDTCYKCGGTGHWAMDCRGPAPPPPPVSTDQPEEEEPFELPTLEEVARATGTLGPQPLSSSPSINQDRQQHGANEPDHKHKDEMLLNVIRPDYEKPAPPPPMEPLYPLTDDGKVQETPADVYAALKDLGYQSFRPGQEEAIMRILSGLSTLVVLSTGMGKSLCYQLPAYLYSQRSRSITLVISPLVSLMDDQLSGIPSRLKAACIHSNMTMKQREAAIDKVKSGEVCVLLLSPEALVGGGGSGLGCLPSAQELPPVAFACIDEAHCVSEWSHNFRPCYLRLCKVLRERLGVQCLLGLTATATLSTALDIAQHLDITDQDGIAVRSAAVPPNLQLSVSMDKEKDQALVSLLKGDRFGCLDSVIVYCTRREETTRVAALLRTCLQGVVLKENKEISQAQADSAGQRKKDLARKKIRKPLKWQAESYHAGLSASERRRVQNNFMCGELRIVVATVAFGMGLDKSDVRGIIHFNMPKSFESYVQEIGRAGRDGEAAHCHLFLDTEGGDLHELRRHIYADTVDHYTVKRLVQKVFPPCKCKQIHQKQQELIKDIEDSALLEVMDVCDPESSTNLPTQRNVEHTGELNPAAAQEMSHPDSEEVPTQEHGGEKKKEGNENQVAKDEGAVGLAENQDAEVKSEGDREEESSDWPRERVCHTHERAIPIQLTVEALDITEEGVETLLCYLELHPQRFVELLHPTMSVCKISCYDGPRQLQKITKICPPAAVVLARSRMAGEKVELCDQLEFDVVEVADTMGWQLPLVKRGLRQLQWSTDRGGGRSGIHVEFSAPSFYFRSYGDLSDEEMDKVCRFLHNRVQEQERTQLYQLTACFKAFKSVAFRSVLSCIDDLDAGRSLQLKNLLSEYFDKRRDREQTLKPMEVEELDKYKILDWEGQIRADIRSLLSNRSDEKFSGRAVARILHGIGSPCYPAQTYGRDRRYWRKYIQFDFNQIIRLATQEIIHFK